MELNTNIINTTLEHVKYTEAFINFDNSELIKFVNDVTAKYANLIVTEGDLSSITKEIAQLNKITKAIDDKRKEIKEGYNNPLFVFENKIKEVTAIINETVIKLKSQTEIFEKQRKEEIKVNLLALIDEIVAEQNLDVKYKPQVIIQDNYYNKTAKEKLIREDILRQVVLLKQAQELNELKAKQEADEQERKRVELETKIKARYELVETLNKEHGFTFAAKSLENYSDVELISYYNNAVKMRTTVAPQQQQTTFNSITQPSKTLATAESLKNKPVRLTIANINELEAQRISKSVTKTFTHAVIDIIEE